MASSRSGSQTPCSSSLCPPANEGLAGRATLTKELRPDPPPLTDARGYCFAQRVPPGHVELFQTKRTAVALALEDAFLEFHCRRFHDPRLFQIIDTAQNEGGSASARRSATTDKEAWRRTVRARFASADR